MTFDEAEMTEEERILAQTVETFYEDGRMRMWALLLDVVELTFEWTSGDFDSPDYRAVLFAEPASVSRFDEEDRFDILERLSEVARNNGRYRVRELDIRRRMPRVDRDWREKQERRISSEHLTNQARNVRHDPTYPRTDNFTFRSNEEIRVYTALKEAQRKATGTAYNFGIFPLPSGLLPFESTREPDFLITINKRVGVIEVDGPHHAKSGRYGADVSRDHHYREAGIALVDRLVVDDTRDQSEIETFVASFLRHLYRA